MIREGRNLDTWKLTKDVPNIIKKKGLESLSRDLSGPQEMMINVSTRIDKQEISVDLEHWGLIGPAMCI
jgi:hypothetical protein